MRALTEKETHTLFSKLANYTGRSLNDIIVPSQQEGDNNDNDRYVFRLDGSRVYYVRLSLANLATSIPRDCLLSLGTCMGKFTKTGKFRLHITAVDVIAPHARYKVWIKKNGEMPFLYGGNILKAHIGRWSEDCPEHQGVVVMNMDDTPLGFGVTAKSTAEIRRLDPTGIATFRQADIGEYLREVSLWISLRYRGSGMLTLLYRKIPFSQLHSIVLVARQSFSWGGCLLHWSLFHLLFHERIVAIFIHRKSTTHLVAPPFRAASSILPSNMYISFLRSLSAILAPLKSSFSLLFFVWYGMHFPHQEVHQSISDIWLKTYIVPDRYGHLSTYVYRISLVVSNLSVYMSTHPDVEAK